MSLYNSLLAAVGVAAYEIKVVTGPVEMGESPYWCEETETVSFVDIIGKQVLRYNPAFPGELQSVSFSKQLHCNTIISHDVKELSQAYPPCLSLAAGAA